MAYMGKQFEKKKEWIYVYVLLIYFALYLKLIQHCNSTIFQLKKLKTKNNAIEKRPSLHPSLKAPLLAGGTRSWQVAILHSTQRSGSSWLPLQILRLWQWGERRVENCALDGAGTALRH